MNWRCCLVLAGAFAFSPVADAQRSARVLDAGGVHLAYSDTGTGVPVVLLHGFTGSASRHWERPGVISALEAAGYRAIALDIRGHGASDKPRELQKYGLEMVSDIVRLLDALKIQRAHIVGYSLGGAIAAQLVVNYPQRVLTGTMLASGWEGDNLTAFTSDMTMMAESLDRGDATGLIGRVGQGGLTQADLDAATADLFARNDPKVLATVARTIPSLYQISREQLQRIDLPMLAIVGDDDPPALGEARRMAGVVKGMLLIVLPGATHASAVRSSAGPIVTFLNAHRN